LDLLVVADGGHELAPAATKERLILLVEGLRAEGRRLNHELRDVRSLDIAVARDELPAEQIPRSDRERVLKILAAVA
jgi:hypothetical protein